MAEYTEAMPEIVELLNDVFEKWHANRIGGARIAVVCQDKAGTRQGRCCPAHILKPSAKLRPLLAEQYDYVVVVAMDTWDLFDDAQRTAMLDHELCHAVLGRDGWELRGHDLEEFAAVIARHGNWRQDGTEEAVEQAYLLPRDKGTIEAPKLRKLA